MPTTLITAMYELKFLDGGRIAIDTIVRWKTRLPTICNQRSELNYLIYKCDPIGYADLVLNGNPEIYLKTVTEYKPLD